jgi:hypothetical protein
MPDKPDNMKTTETAEEYLKRNSIDEQGNDFEYLEIGKVKIYSSLVLKECIKEMEGTKAKPSTFYELTIPEKLHNATINGCISILKKRMEGNK